MIPQEKYYSPERGPDLRKNPNKISGRWSAAHMWEIHHEIARRLVLGQKNVEIAKDLNVTPVMVSNVRNSPVVQEHMAVMKGARDADTVDLAQEIREVAPDALGLLKEIIRGEGEGQGANLTLRARLSENMLARVGHGVPHKVQSENVHAVLSLQDIEDIKRRAKLAGQGIPQEQERSSEDAEFTVVKEADE